MESGLKFQGFFIDLFKGFFGPKANRVMCVIMFFLTAPGKELLRQIGIAFDSPEGKELMKEFDKMLREKIEGKPDA